MTPRHFLRRGLDAHNFYPACRAGLFARWRVISGERGIFWKSLRELPLLSEPPETMSVSRTVAFRSNAARIPKAR
jgi:hypothetical protein